MINQKTIDRIRENCNERLRKDYRLLENPIQDFMIVYILQEYFKILLEEK